MKILVVITIVSSVLLTVAILLQNQGAGLGTAFGSDGGYYRSKRGAEKSLYWITIVLSVIFVASVLGALFVR